MNRRNIQKSNNSQSAHRKKKTKTKRATHVITDKKSVRLRSLKHIIGLFLPPTIYVSYCVSGLYRLEVNLYNVREQTLWCLMHPFQCCNEKTVGVVAVGLLIWGVCSVSAYTRMSLNLMHGEEYGSAKWGDVKKFNEKYADTTDHQEVGLSAVNKVLSENVRFRYDSNTLRNNNILVVGGSGAGKTSFFLTPNLLSLHDCNIYTDPKGTLAEELGGWLSKQPDTKVYVLNLCEMEKSMHFNPFVYLRSKADLTKMITNLIQNTNSEKIKNNSADPFWERAEKLFLESVFLYVWMECPMGFYNERTGKAELLERNWKSVLFLIDEAQFGEGDIPPKLDERMNRLEKRTPGHPAVKAYKKYRNGPDETVRSVIMTVNARMQPFDNEELIELFSENDIPLNEFGVGRNGDGRTKSNLFIVIPDDDSTYNFVPGIVYTLLFEELYRQARFFGGKLPMDVGMWFDEFANTKMPADFDKILATCRSRGVYCVPILQSLAQLKTLFADGAWEGIAGNCDTFLYLGGNEASTFEYVSKMLGKWTIDKKTTGESKGSSGSSSENYDVLGRELMQEYEVRLLPDDECILFVRGESPIRDKKWFPWEHEEYLEARAMGAFDRTEQMEQDKEKEEDCAFLDEHSLSYLKKQQSKEGMRQSYGIDAFAFMMMDLEQVMGQTHTDGQEHTASIDNIRPELIQRAITQEQRRIEAEQREWYVKHYESLSLLDIYSSNMIGEQRRNVIRELKGKGADDDITRSIVRPELSESEVVEKKRSWLEMNGDIAKSF